MAKFQAMKRKPNKTHLSAEFVRSVLTYDPETGFFRWRRRSDRPKRWNTRYAGSVAGQMSSGYRCIQLESTCGAYRACRLAWLYMTGEWPADQIDHINGVRWDDRWENLRAADNSQNNANRGAQRNNQSCGVRGVSFHALTGKWAARIKAKGVPYYLGLFPTVEEAAAAYAEAARRLHGEFSRTE